MEYLLSGDLVGWWVCIVNETEWIRPFAILLFSNSDVNPGFPTSMDLKLEFCSIEKKSQIHRICA